MSCVAPVQESPTIYSVFLQSESEKERKSEMVEQQQPAVRNSASASSIMSGHSKKKTLEKKTDQQYMLEDALQQVVRLSYFCNIKTIYPITYVLQFFFG